MSNEAGGKSALSAGLDRMALPPVWRLLRAEIELAPIETPNVPR